MAKSNVDDYGIDKKWLNVLNNSTRYSMFEKENAFKYARYNFMTIIKDNDIFELSLETFVEMLKSDDLIVDDETRVFEAIKMWINFNLSNPLDVLGELIQVVRLTYLPTEYLIDTVLPYIWNANDCQKYFAEALHWKLSTKRKLNTERTNPRKSSSIISPITKCLLAVGSGDFNTSKMVEIYDSTKVWRRLPNLNIPNRNYSAAILNNNLIIAGGYNGDSVNTVNEINLKTGTMNSLSPMNTARHNFPMVATNEGQSSKLFAIGGKGIGFNCLNSVEVYNSKSNSWKFVSPMILVREGCGAALHNNQIYVAGGYSNLPQRTHNSLEVYDIGMDKWQMKSQMIESRVYCSAVSSGNFLYVMGGYGNISNLINSVERYDIVNDAWIKVANMSNSGIIGAGILENSPVSVGGRNSNTVEKYDVDRNLWIKLEPLSTPREIVYVVSLPPEFNDIVISW